MKTEFGVRAGIKQWFFTCPKNKKKSRSLAHCWFFCVMGNKNVLRSYFSQ